MMLYKYFTNLFQAAIYHCHIVDEDDVKWIGGKKASLLIKQFNDFFVLNTLMMEN